MGGMIPKARALAVGRRIVSAGTKRAALGAAEAAGGAGFAYAAHQRGEGFRYKNPGVKRENR